MHTHTHTHTHILFAPLRHILLVHTRPFYLQSKQVTILFLTNNDDPLCNAVLTVCNSPVISYLCRYSARCIGMYQLSKIICLPCWSKFLAKRLPHAQMPVDENCLDTLEFYIYPCRYIRKYSKYIPETFHHWHKQNNLRPKLKRLSFIHRVIQICMAVSWPDSVAENKKKVYINIGLKTVW